MEVLTTTSRTMQPLTTTSSSSRATQPRSMSAVKEYVYVNSTEIVYRNVTVWKIGDHVWSPLAIGGFSLSAILLVCLLIFAALYYVRFRTVSYSPRLIRLNTTNDSENNDSYSMQVLGNASTRPLVVRNSEVHTL